MPANELISVRILAGGLLVLGFVVFLPAGLLYARREIWKQAGPIRPAYLVWERGLVMAAVVAAVLGWVLLDRLLEAAGEILLAPLGLAALLIGAALVLVAETYNLSKRE